MLENNSNNKAGCTSVVKHVAHLVQKAPAWQSRFGGVLALKYAGAAVSSLGKAADPSPSSGMLQRIIALTVDALSDEDDDVRSTAATAVEAIVVATRSHARHSSTIDANTTLLLHQSLWSALDRSDELSASAVSI
jgi:hypothetical protein